MQQICWFSRSYGKTENHLLTDYNRSAHGQFIFVNKTWSNPFFCFPFDFWTFWCVFELFEGNGQKLVHFDFFWSFGVWKLLPLQGALLIAIIPRALPWARSFCPFRAYGVILPARLFYLFTLLPFYFLYIKC